MSKLVRIAAAMRERMRGLFLRRRVESEMEEELRFHMEMEAAKLARAGVQSDEARRRAAATFGGVERYKDEVREARGLAWIPGTRLDFALGLRMMKKHPSLSVVGGIGMAVGIAMSVGMFAFIRAHVYPTLPLDEGERIISIENRDITVNNEERRSLHDFHLWRAEVKSVEDLGAFRTVTRDLGIGEGRPDPIELAEMTASGFKVARVAPFMGRYLLPDDERPESPAVVVIGHDLWRSRFGSRRDIIGEELRLAGVAHTIVGVMPEKFAFPQNHRIWVPLRANPLSYERRRGPAIYIFGRLAPDATMETAQTELSAIGKRAAATYPQNAKLEPMVMPYTHSLIDIQGIAAWEILMMQATMTVLLVVVALNVAILVYARTATRQGEIAVRTALGASRARIVTQLFIEALTLSLCSAAAGLALGHFGLVQASGIMDAEMGASFWVSYRVDPLTILFTVGVAVFAAVIIGVLPALQATGKRLQVSLRELGGSGMRLGRTWTALVVSQIAIAVAVLPAAVSFAWGEIQNAFTERTYDPSEYASAYIEVGGEDADGRAVRSERPLGDRVVEIVRRIEEEPTIVGATYWAALPGRRGRMEVEGIAAPPGATGWRVATSGGAPNYVEFFDAKIVAGRGLNAQDAGDSLSTSVVVNRAFVDQVLGASQVLGRRIRYAGRPAAAGDPAVEPSRWHQIVGVVENDRINTLAPETILPEVYYVAHPSQLALAEQIYIEVRMRGTTAPVIAPRLREIIAQVDPALRMGGIESQSDLDRQTDLIVRLIGLGLGLVLISVFLLSAAGIYALVSFTITRRRKEIGIRTALGASQRQVLFDVLGPVARQIALGLVIGIAGAAAIDRISDGGLFSGKAGVLLPVFGILMTMVALGAAFGPARRGLKTQPTEALRAEA